MRREVKVGIFALVVLVGLYWGINFLRGRDIFGTSDTYYASYEQVGGLQKSSAVTARGVKVGVVSGIELGEKVTVTLDIDSKFRIPNNSQARIYSGGLMNGKAIEIVLGNSGKYLENGDTLHSYSDPGLLEAAGLELGALTAKLSATADNATKLLATINDILEKNRGDIDGVFGGFSRLSESLAREGEALHRTVGNVEMFSGALAGSAGSMSGAIKGLERFSDNLNKVDLERLDASLRRVDSLLAGIERGDGTLGKLVVDDAMYNSLARASEDLAILLEDLKANPGRYVSVSVFGRKQK
jgi:phospholipid/cholesterol/gamma-HCH transport system substrate-binding protein